MYITVTNAVNGTPRKRVELPDGMTAGQLLAEYNVTAGLVRANGRTLDTDEAIPGESTVVISPTGLKGSRLLMAA